MQKTNTKLAVLSPDIAVNNITAIQTTRIHPFGEYSSRKPYSEFNLGLHVGDYASDVNDNRKALLKLLPTGSNIQWLNQIHSDKVVCVNTITNDLPNADAIITKTAKLALAIMTADCLPVLISNQQGTEIAAIHCGWRPLAANIIEKTIAAMQSDASELLVWLGPSISQQNFEVGAEVQASFCDVWPELSSCFNYQSAKDKYLADLPAIAALLLGKLGVENITGLPRCTYAESEWFYSYRREHVTGRMASIICIN